VIYVTDTHPLIFVVTGKLNRLGRKAKRVFQAAHEGKNVIVIPISALEEAMRLSEKQIIKFKQPFHRWAQEIDKAPNFQIQPYTLEIFLEVAGLASIRDPADRAIVATARHLGYPLVTADETIQDGEWVETVWE
jgi:PIN domain nuclease of toxin-antitoxin system